MADEGGRGFSTRSIHGAAPRVDQETPSVPIYQTSTFEVTDSDEQVRATSTDRFYTRYGNPTHTVAESSVAELEGADGALLFASGMSAITTSILAVLKSGDHIVAQRDIYGGVTKFFSQWLPKLGIETTFWIPRNMTSMNERFGPVRDCCIWNRRPILH